ncbi:MAG: molecular chaperone TorD family protein [Wenzhouxiangellaceae bacterium]|nr:molecular chaperone TorD family protein [Wenzhouxiangellaceae bacterium]
MQLRPGETNGSPGAPQAPVSRPDFGSHSGPEAPEAGSLRSASWRLLARLFAAPPDAELLQRLAACGRDGDATPLGKTWNRLASAAEAADPAAVDDEFHALFIGLGRGEVLPYASWYLSGYLLDKPLAKLRADLAQLGIERDRDAGESEDHAAAVSETMALLVDPGQGADSQTQQHFFERHVDSWMAHFLDDVLAARNADFYRRVARHAQAFLEFERRWLDLPA